MATAAAIIKRSLRLINALAAGETPPAAEQADALEALNAMLDAWRNESLSVYSLRDETLTLTGATTYTIGSGGDLNTTRPVKIEGAFQRVGSIDYPVRLAQRLAYNDIADKATSSDIIDWLYYEPAHPLGTLYVYPVSSSGVLHLTTWTPLTAFALSDEVSLPPGYQEAITYQLAARLAPEYGRPVPMEVAAIGKAAKDDIKRVNFRAPLMDTGIRVMRRYDIQADY